MDKNKTLAVLVKSGSSRFQIMGCLDVLSVASGLRNPGYPLVVVIMPR